MINRDLNIKPWKIMIVDDDPLVIKTLERILFKKNYLFISIKSGEEALEQIAEIKPDMVLLDVFMKELSGFEVCSQLKKTGFTKKVPVIFLTGNANSGEIVKGFQSGAVDYILKPFNAEELLARINTHLELKRIREEIKMMNLIKTRFFSIMTNDIKDALTGVKGVAEFIYDEVNAIKPNINEIAKLASILRQDSFDLFQFVDNLIKWDRIESEGGSLTESPVNLNELTNETLASFKTWWQGKSINIVNNLPGKLFINSNKDALHSIFRELLSNAIKYSPCGGKVIIDGSSSSSVVSITFSDDGVGIDKDVIEHIFRLDTPHPKTIGTGNEKGIGLGLIICNTWVKKLGGVIKIDSEKHLGTTVTLEIPANYKS